MLIIDVILHHPDWKIHCGNSTMEQLERMPVVKYQDWMGTELSIEAIPEKIIDENLRKWQTPKQAGFENS